MLLLLLDYLSNLCLFIMILEEHLQILALLVTKFELRLCVCRLRIGHFSVAPRSGLSVGHGRGGSLAGFHLLYIVLYNL